MIPQTRFARSGKVNIAYQVIGDGALDLVYVPGWVSHLELRWEEPEHARFLHRLASFSRLITFDKRGTGLSDVPIIRGRQRRRHERRNTNSSSANGATRWTSRITFPARCTITSSRV